MIQLSKQCLLLTSNFNLILILIKKIFQGHDTTGMNISWALYMLGLHEDIQDKVREELDRIIVYDECENISIENAEDEGVLAKHLKTTNITIEHIREMKYLDCVIKETLRMWPSIPFVARQLTEDLKIGECFKCIS